MLLLASRVSGDCQINASVSQLKGISQSLFPVWTLPICMIDNMLFDPRALSCIGSNGPPDVQHVCRLGQLPTQSVFNHWGCNSSAVRIISLLVNGCLPIACNRTLQIFYSACHHLHVQQPHTQSEYASHLHRRVQVLLSSSLSQWCSAAYTCNSNRG